YRERCVHLHGGLDHHDVCSSSPADLISRRVAVDEICVVELESEFGFACPECMTDFPGAQVRINDGSRRVTGAVMVDQVDGEGFLLESRRELIALNFDWRGLDEADAGLRHKPIMETLDVRISHRYASSATSSASVY